MARTLEGFDRVREHGVWCVVEQQPMNGIGIAQDDIDPAPQPVERDAQVLEEVTLDLAHEEVSKDFKAVGSGCGSHRRQLQRIENVQGWDIIAPCKRFCGHYAFDLLPDIEQPVGLPRIMCPLPVRGKGVRPVVRPRVRTVGCVTCPLRGDPP